MSLTPRAMLGSHESLPLLVRLALGEVYRARDGKCREAVVKIPIIQEGRL